MQDLQRKKASTATEAAEQIQKIIIDTDLQPGDRLPSQSELAERLGAGTRSIREAIKILEARGMLETHQGKGVFVKNNSLDFFLEILNDSLTFDLYRDNKILLQLTYVRRMIQSNVIYDLAEKPDPELLKTLVQILHEMEACLPDRQVEAYNVLDAKFHIALIAASGNDILVTLYRHLTSPLMKSIEKTGYIPGSLELSIADHRHILEALIARDAERAKELMYKHLSKTLHSLEELID
jgi:GntR family transcriptional regulator, transcriptional repressor for pyruvate dehydrogenase complex